MIGEPRAGTARKLLAQLDPFWTVVVIAFILKLLLAWFTIGSNDVLFFEAYAKKIATDGPVALYRDGTVLLDALGQPRHKEGFFHPPFVIHLLSFLNRIVTRTGLQFSFLFRLLSITADVGSALLLKDILRNYFPEKRAYLLACVFAGCPTLILLSGFHGNTDPVMIFFLVLSVWLLLKRNLPWAAGLAFGMSCEIKIWPLLLVPVLVLYVPGLRNRIWFAMAAALIFLTTALPVAAMGSKLVAERVFNYSSLSGQWGLSRLLPLSTPISVFAFYEKWGRYAIIAAGVVLAVWMHYKSKSSLPLRIGLMTSMFLVITPGFGIQYLAWYLPWVVFLGTELTLIYFLCTSIFMFHVYSFWSNGLPWRLADTLVTGSWRGFMIWHELLCWSCLLWLLFLSVREVRIFNFSFEPAWMFLRGWRSAQAARAMAATTHE